MSSDSFNGPKLDQGETPMNSLAQKKRATEKPRSNMGSRMAEPAHQKNTSKARP